MTGEPTLRVLSLGAGVQSTVLLLMSARGELPRVDAAVFADTGWEPRIGAHLDRLEAEVAAPAGIAIHRVSNGNLRDDALDPDQMRSIPAYTLGPDGEKGMQKRACTQQYKLRPILAQTRRLLGASTRSTPCRHCEGTGQRIAPWRAKRGEHEVGPCSVCRGEGVIHRVGNAPRGTWAEQWVGFSTDEIERVSPRGDTGYSRSRHPLLELGMSRTQCTAYLDHHGWTAVEKSACVGCPYRSAAEWRRMRDTDPEAWADAVAFDEAYRVGAGMRHRRYLHISCTPLAQAPIDRIRPSDHHQIDLFDVAFEEALDSGDRGGCSPWGCDNETREAA
ncbi:hypothetical protein [Embleya hyalina]|uniref:Phosphoadenosine phosphosulfate reductase n=1 Tax=Embleya hyalina TaxID=516124 RepID=A0A401YR98_9ACTN|nr:hypothetical protein [Embleya hyalina]GCD97117.1 hypothetical protein EHYA_04805 [Embleya hyalina]